MEGNGLDMRHVAKCGVNDTEIRRCMEEYGTVTQYKGKDYEGWSQQSHEMELHIWLAQSRMCVGPERFGVVRKRGLEHQEKKAPDGRGQGRLRDFLVVECETLGRIQATKLENV